MKYTVEIPEGRYCNEGKTCIFFITLDSTYYYCNLLEEPLEIERKLKSEFIKTIKSVNCPAKKT